MLVSKLKEKYSSLGKIANKQPTVSYKKDKKKKKIYKFIEFLML